MNDSFVRARSRLILDSPFFGTLCLRLKPVERDDIDTGATDGKHLFYNPIWFEKLRPEERIGFLAHEVMHVVFMHHTRRQERHAEKWNVAADYVINLILKSNAFILPSGGLLDEQYADMTTEHVYSILPEPPEGFGALLSAKGAGDVLDHPDAGSSESVGAVESQLTVAIQQAAEQARAQGKLPANMNTLIEDIVNLKLIGVQYLQDFCGLIPILILVGYGLTDVLSGKVCIFLLCTTLVLKKLLLQLIHLVQ